MNWSTFSDFAAMGGYGLYVWGSFGGCALVIAAELLSLRARRRALHGSHGLHAAAAQAAAPHVAHVSYSGVAHEA